MKLNLARAFTVIMLLATCAAANADRIEEVWICKVNDGKSMDDVNAANSKWVKFVNANVKGGDIASSVVTPVVGDIATGTFIYVDSFPSLESWAASRPALEMNDEGKAIDAELNAAATCSENQLYSSKKS